MIREEEADTPGYTTGFGSGSGMGAGLGDGSPGDLSVPDAYSQAVTFAFGMISVSDKIYVTFELLRR